LSGTTKFLGSCLLDGHSNNLALDNNSLLIIGHNSSLRLRNVKLDNIFSGKILCLDDTAQLILDNTQWVQSANYSFTRGSILFCNEVDLLGPYKFTYQSSITSTLSSFASVTLDRGLTFSYDPSSGNKQLINFTDSSAKIILCMSTLNAWNGIKLTKGSMVIDDVSSFVIGNNKAITIGNDASSDDFTVVIVHGSTLHVSGGTLIYKNINDASWNMAAKTTALCMVNATLQLDQTLNIGSGRLFLYPGATQTNAVGKTLIGITTCPA